MKRKLSLFLCVFAALFCLLTVGAAAKTYTADELGQYTVPLTFDANGEYIIFALKGEYDQTNYIEAFNKADDSNIIYFEQKASDEDGNVTFGPFVPKGYFDATLIVGGTSLEEPIIAGYLSAEDISNTASISISGVESAYTVNGIGSGDISIKVDASVYDSFGYPSMTNEEITIKLLNNSEDVSLEGNVITVSETAKEQAFVVSVSAGDANETAYVQIKRAEFVYRELRVYADEACTEAVNQIEVFGLDGKFDNITVYIKSFDQFGDEVDDEYVLTYANKNVGTTFKPVAGDSLLSIVSTKSPLSTGIVVCAKPLYYQASALELYGLLNECRAKLDEEKNVSAEDGKDVYGDEKWTTEKAVNTFASAISTAQDALDLYGSSGYGDDDYADEITVLNKALATYNNSFKDGIRIDALSISIKEQGLVLPVGTEKTKLTVTTNPRITTEKLTWTSSDPNVAKVDENGNVDPDASGKTVITATTRNGLTASTEITVYKKATRMELNPSSVTATYRSDVVVIEAKIFPYDCTDDIELTVNNEDYAELIISEPVVENEYLLIKATVVPKSAGKTAFTVKALRSGVSKTGSITVKMPEWGIASAPYASVESGSVVAGTEIELKTLTEGASIYYTLDGTTPSVENGRIYKTPIVVNQNLTLKAITYADEMYDSEVVTYEYKIVDTKASISNAVVRPAFSTVLDLNVSDYEDVKSATFVIEYDKNAIYDVALNDEYDAQNGITVECDGTENSGTLTVTLSKEDGFSYSGKVAELCVVVHENAKEGVSAVRITSALIQKTDGSTVESAASDGYVTISNYIIGDANNDGRIGLADVLIIKQYLSGNQTAKKIILLDAADVDGDDDIDNDDVILLSKYCVGLNVVINQRHGTGLLPD